MSDATQTKKMPAKKPADTANFIRLKAHISRFLRWPIMLGSRLMRISKPHSWIIEGTEIHSEQKLRIFFSGVETNREYISNLAFGSSYTKSYLGQRWLWSDRPGNCDLVIREVPLRLKRFLNRSNCFLVPDWVVGTFDLSMDIIKHISQDRTLSNDRRKIEKNGLYLEVTQDEDQFDKFYNEMLVPYIRARWGKQANTPHHDVLKQYFNMGELLLVKQGMENIAGALIYYGKKVPEVMVLGIKDGKLEYLKIGAMAATWQFTVKYLKERGYHCMDVGSTRAFLNDSVLLHKKKWGLKIDSLRDYGFRIDIWSTNSGVQGFFLNNPFMFIRGSDLIGAIFIEAGKSLEKSDFINTYKKYDIQGLSRISLYQFSEDGRIQECLPPSDECTPDAK
jgi:hypothetical protein